MLAKFCGSTCSTMVLALALTPEMTNALAILVAAIFVGLVNLYMARTARLVAVRETAKAIAPIEAKIDAQAKAIAPIEAKIDAQAKAIAPIEAKIDEQAKIAARIDGHVNSEKTRAEGESAALRMEIQLQREMIDKMEKAALLLAQALATTTLTNAVAQAAVAGATTLLPHAPSPPARTSSSTKAEQSLVKIDENTAAIEKNTASTEATVQDLKEKT